MATFTAKVLADGQLPNAKGTLYTVPGATKAYVKFLHCHNGTATNGEAVKIYTKPGATSRLIGQATLNAGQAVRIIDKDEAVTLEAGDLIEGSTTTAATIDYVITGVEET
jgi:hypothetical protein